MEGDLRINVIDRPAEGRPLLLAPEGLLLRWPRDKPSGTAIRLTRPEHRRHLAALLHGNAIERCEAAQKLPQDVVIAAYSRSLANNMRRVARDMTPGFRAHVLYLIQEGHRVSTRQLIAAVSGRTEAQ